MEKPTLQPFDTKDVSSIGTRWRKWKRQLELYLEVNCIALPTRKRAYLLHYAGPEVQDIFYELEGHDANPPIGSDVYKEAIKLLNAHFAPLASIPYDRFVFRNIKQEADETVEKFVSRLREQGRLCEYGPALDMRITEQIFDNCLSDELREMILKKKLMTVAGIVQEAQILETVKRNKEQMQKSVVPTEEASISQVRSSRQKDVCFRCGARGHYANDKQCPARKKVCDRCKLVGHFKKMCKTKVEHRQSSRKKDMKVRQLEEAVKCSSSSSEYESDGDDDEPDVQQICTAGDKHDKVTLYTGGVKLDWIIDSGAQVNVVSRKTWQMLKDKGCRVSYDKRSRKCLTVYGNGKLGVQRVIKTDISTRSKMVHHNIYVTDRDEGENLLSKDTSVELGILKICGEVFAVPEKPDPPIGKIKNLQVELKFDPKVTPVQQPCRRLPIPLQDLVEEKIQDLLRQDIIEPAPLKITWASPLVVTPKEGGKSVRLCVDMRRANRAIIPERHPLPTFEEIMLYLDGCNYFSKIDLVKAFHQIELSPASRDITTFVTPTVYYRYKRLMFGMSCAAEIFQREIERILKGLKGIKVFIDDILVFGATQEEHNLRVKAVLKRLKDHGLTINEDKCQIGVQEVNFLGHTLSAKGILPVNDKVSAIQSFRRPQNSTEMRSFLGLVNYVGRFIPNLSTISAPLREMTLKGNKFHWSKDAKIAFEKIKMSLSNPKHLGYYNPKYPTTLVTDASDHGLGAVLLQSDKGKPRVIAYASKSLSKTEKKYPTLDKEALAIVWAAERYQMYLKGLEFTVLTDHKPLVAIFNEKSMPNQRQERWVLRMQAFRYTIVHVPGKVNIADTFSRLPEISKDETFDKQAEPILCSIAEVCKPGAVTMGEVIQCSKDDDEIQKVKEALHSDHWEGAIKRYAAFKSELCFAEEVLLRKSRMVVPVKLRQSVLTLAHTGHPGREKMKRRLRVAVWWPGVDGDVEKYCRECVECQMVAPYDKPEPLRIRDLPSAPWVHLAGDFLGPLPDGSYLFVLVDLYSRYVLADPMKSTTSKDIIRVLKQHFTRMGLPYMLTFDNAKNFSSQEFKDFCVDLGIKLVHTTPYWPSANGEIERQNRSFLKVLKISQLNGTNWKDALQDYLYMYAITPHSVTAVAPAQLMFGRRFRDLIPHLQDEKLDDGEMRDRDRLVKFQAKENWDKRMKAKESSIVVGDEVLMKNMVPNNKLAPKFLGTPVKVIDRFGNSLTLETADGRVYKRNTSHVKPFVRPMDSEISLPKDQLEPAQEAEHEGPEFQPGPGPRPKRDRRIPKRFDDYSLNI